MQDLRPGPSAPASVEAEPAPRLVLDTQVLLDWLVFANPGVAPLVKAIESGRVQWLVEPGGVAELLHVSGREALRRYAPDRARIEAAIAAYAHCEATAELRLPGLICRDPDDQRFIDLALASRARWLVSRDRAVLALARRARLRGLNILPPERWAP